jgi:ferric-dicitrate binding protein FerR (iron transport regulator)
MSEREDIPMPRTEAGNFAGGAERDIDRQAGAAQNAERRADASRERRALAGDDEAVRLLREIRGDLARLTRISEKAARRARDFNRQIERSKAARRVVIGLLIAIAVLLLIQILQMMGYGPGGGGSDSGSSQTLQKVYQHPAAPPMRALWE